MKITQHGDNLWQLTRLFAFNCYLVREKDELTLIAGDTFQTQAGIAVAGVRRWLFPFPAMATWHLPTALESAIALRRLEPRRLAVGHGRVLNNPSSMMDKAIAEAEAKALDQTQAIKSEISH